MRISSSLFAVVSLLLMLLAAGETLAAVELYPENYVKIVTDAERDVVVYYYSQHCPQCRAFQDAYRVVSRRLSPTQDLVLAKMDAAVHSDFLRDNMRGDLNQVPTVIMYTKNDKSGGHTFNGPFTQGALMDFIFSFRDYEDL